MIEIMKLPDLLEKHRIYTIRELCRRTGLTPQQGWHFWHHKRGLTLETLKLLHQRLGISYDELMELDPPEPRQKEETPRKPRSNPQGRPRRKRSGGQSNA